MEGYRVRLGVVEKTTSPCALTRLMKRSHELRPTRPRGRAPSRQLRLEPESSRRTMCRMAAATVQPDSSRDRRGARCRLRVVGRPRSEEGAADAEPGACAKVAAKDNPKAWVTIRLGERPAALVAEVLVGCAHPRRTDARGRRRRRRRSPSSPSSPQASCSSRSRPGARLRPAPHDLAAGAGRARVCRRSTILSA